MIVRDVTNTLEELAPLANAEEFDNVGLLVGSYDQEVSGILVTLDCLENVVDEAIATNCNTIISFHPIIFNGLKRINGNSYVERVVIKAIKHDIAIYSMHTALDNSIHGVNAKICEVLGLGDTKILIPKNNRIKKLTTYAPIEVANSLKNALFDAGAGNIGDYSNCSFTLVGEGSFKAGEKASPTIGSIGKTHTEKETQINITFTASNEKQVLNALFEHHPYDEIAYEVLTLENTDQHIGMGMIGTLEHPMKELEFLEMVKKRMGAKGIRHSNLLGKNIEKVAVLGGSGAFGIQAAIASGADIFITADVKYHQFYEAEGRMIIADIGHYETEQFTKNLLVDYLTKKNANFAIRLSESKTNPIKYL